MDLALLQMQKTGVVVVDSYDWAGDGAEVDHSRLFLDCFQSGSDYMYGSFMADRAYVGGPKSSMGDDGRADIGRQLDGGRRAGLPEADSGEPRAPKAASASE